MPDYRKLRAWQLARDLAIQSRPLIKQLPSEEGPLEFRRHLDIARGSLHELEVIFELVIGQDYLKPDDLEGLRTMRSECARTVWGLIRSIERRLPS